MSKNIVRIVLTGGPAAGKTSLVNRIIEEFKHKDGWRLITIPETATELMGGFGIKPFGGCVCMEDFQYFVISDQLHKEKLALWAAEMVPEENILILYDRAVFDDRAYISDEEFDAKLSYFGKTKEELLSGYTAVVHLVTCAQKGTEDEYNYGNVVRYEDIDGAKEADALTLRSWSEHPNVHVIKNEADFELKMNKALKVILEIVDNH